MEEKFDPMKRYDLVEKTTGSDGTTLRGFRQYSESTWAFISLQALNGIT